MNTGAELESISVQTTMKTFNGGRTPLTPSGYASALNLIPK